MDLRRIVFVVDRQVKAVLLYVIVSYPVSTKAKLLLPLKAIASVYELLFANKDLTYQSIDPKRNIVFLKYF